MNALGRHLIALGLMEPEPHWFGVLITHLKAFKAEQGHCKVQGGYICHDGYPLGKELVHTRKNRTLTPGQRTELDDLGVPWNYSDWWFTEFVKHLSAFKTEYGHCRVTCLYVNPQGYKLGRMALTLRQRPQRVSPAQRIELDVLGFPWVVNKDWFTSFLEHFRAYKTENGHGRVPANHTCSDGYKLGQKVSCIRYGSNKPTEEQRALLDAEGFVWNAGTKGLWWPAFIDHMRAYKAENGHCRVPRAHVCSDGYKLSRIVLAIRSGHIRVTDEQRALLDAEGFVWDAREWWPEFISHFLAFKAENGPLVIRKNYKCSDGYELGQKVSHIRSGHIQTTDEQRAILNAEGFKWVVLVPTSWPEFLEHFRAYKAENGHGRVPANHICFDGYKLGQKVGRIRTGSIRVTDEQRALLDAEGFVWDAREWWPLFIFHLRAYVAKHGHCRMPYAYICTGGYQLGEQCGRVRSGSQALTVEQRRELDTLGFIWSWYQRFLAHLLEFKATHGHCNVAVRYIAPDGYKLGHSVAWLRSGRKDLTEEQRQELDTLGFLWRMPNEPWYPRFLAHLKTFIVEHGHCKVTSNYTCPDGYKLGQQVGSVRAGGCTPTTEQRAELDALGFIWRAAKKSQRVGSP